MYRKEGEVAGMGVAEAVLLVTCPYQPGAHILEAGEGPEQRRKHKDHVDLKQPRELVCLGVLTHLARPKECYQPQQSRTGGFRRANELRLAGWSLWNFLSQTPQ